jgi:hypothetical protein
MSGSPLTPRIPVASHLAVTPVSVAVAAPLAVPIVLHLDQRRDGGLRCRRQRQSTRRHGRAQHGGDHERQCLRSFHEALHFVLSTATTRLIASFLIAEGRIVAHRDRVPAAMLRFVNLGNEFGCAGFDQIIFEGVSHD